jgi:hypothetical protein
MQLDFMFIDLIRERQKGHVRLSGTTAGKECNMNVDVRRSNTHLGTTHGCEELTEVLLQDIVRNLRGEVTNKEGKVACISSNVSVMGSRMLVQVARAYLNPTYFLVVNVTTLPP